MHPGAGASPQEETYAQHPDFSSAEVNEDILFRFELHSQLNIDKKVRRNKILLLLLPFLL
jgi:hypothetical protein